MRKKATWPLLGLFLLCGLSLSTIGYSNSIKITPGNFLPFCSNNSETCATSILIPFTIESDCSNKTFTFKIFFDSNNENPLTIKSSDIPVGGMGHNGTYGLGGTYPDYFIGSLIDVPIGSHFYIIEISDECGNNGAIIVPFAIVDCQSTAPICRNGISADLTALGAGTDADDDGFEDPAAINLWVDDLVVGTEPDCSEPIIYSLNRMNELPDKDQTSLIITCKDPDVLQLEIYGWDGAFNPYAIQPDGRLGGPNYDFCTTFVQVNDPNKLCAGGPEVEGFIQTEAGEFVEGVGICLDGETVSYTTNVDGVYLIDEDIQTGGEVRITPKLDTDHDNGVTTFDVVLISKHILGTKRLNSPYKWIAADVDNSGSVATLDLINLRKLILHIDSKWRHNTSWRFVDANYTFPTPTNPWQEDIPEYIDLRNISPDGVVDANFIAVKVGDVNGDAAGNSLLSSDIRNYGPPIALELLDFQLTANQQQELVFKNTTTTDLAGIQFTLKFDPEVISLEQIIFGLCKAENFGQKYLEEGLLMVSWNGKAAPGEELFKLAVQSNSQISVREALSIHTKLLKPEAYTFNENTHEVQLQFKPLQNNEDVFEVFPNPFGEVINFQISLGNQSNEIAELSIFDISGKRVYLDQVGLDQGTLHLELTKNEFPTSGMYFYELRIGESIYTGKLIAQ